MKTIVKVDVNNIIMCGARYTKESVNQVVEAIEKMKYTAIINIIIVDSFAVPSDVIFKIYQITRELPTYFVIQYDDEIVDKLFSDLRDMLDTHKISYKRLDKNESDYFKRFMGCLH